MVKLLSYGLTVGDLVTKLSLVIETFKTISNPIDVTGDSGSEAGTDTCRLH